MRERGGGAGGGHANITWAGVTGWFGGPAPELNMSSLRGGTSARRRDSHSQSSRTCDADAPWLRAVVYPQPEHIVLQEEAASQRLQHEDLRERVRWIVVTLQIQTIQCNTSRSPVPLYAAFFNARGKQFHNNSVHTVLPCGNDSNKTVTTRFLRGQQLTFRLFGTIQTIPHQHILIVQFDT